MFVPFASKVRVMRRNSFVGQIVVILLGMQLFFISTFAGFSLPTATAKNMLPYFHNLSLQELRIFPAKYQDYLKRVFPDLNLPAKPVRFSLYVPQAPAAIFIGYVLGPFLGAIAAAMFFILGFVGPVVGIHAFCAGGEAGYFMQPGFGYLIGMIVASWCAGWFTRSQRNSLNQLLAIGAGLAAIHLIGVSYLFGSTLVATITDGMRHAPDWQQWLLEEVRNMTWYQLPYDIIFSILVVGLGFPFRWLINILVAPDIAFRGKPQPEFQEMLSSTNAGEMPAIPVHESFLG